MSIIKKYMEIDKLKMKTLVISNNMQESHKNNNEEKSRQKIHVVCFYLSKVQNAKPICGLKSQKELF